MSALKVGLIGLGGQGRAHAKHLVKCGENDPYRLVAVCDIRPEMFQWMELKFNITENSGPMGFSDYHQYTDMDEMLKKEKLDLVVIALPTYLHCEATVKFLRAGVHVLCEKPMAPTIAECDLMLKTAKETGKKLMIGQCLRFWTEYRILKGYIDSGEFGRVVAANFWRGSDLPTWGYNNWFQHKELGGGAIYDQHVHDVDMVQYLFGMPEAVSTSGKIVVKGSNYDTLCTNYIYKDGPVVFSHNDWTLSCKFSYGFRVNFERATVESGGGKLLLSRKETGETEEVSFKAENALAAETRYFVECVLGEHENMVNSPEASAATIRLVAAEEASADKGAALVRL